MPFPPPEEDGPPERQRKADRKPKKAKRQEAGRKAGGMREDAFANKQKRGRGGARRGRSFDDFVDDDD